MNNIYKNKYNIWTIEYPIIPDAIKVISESKNALKFEDKNSFLSCFDNQRYFSLSSSHCFYTMEDLNNCSKGTPEWRDGSTGISESNKGSILQFECGHEIVAVWDERNKLGYIIPKQ